MKQNLPDPRRLDPAALAARRATLSGDFPLASMARLCESTDDAARVVRWQVDGEVRERQRAAPSVWMRLQVHAEVTRTCQRCLQPVVIPLQVDRWLRFVNDEDTAARLDAESDDDVLALQSHLDLAELVEDELLLAMPVIPLHENCPQPLLAPDDHAPGDEAAGAAGHPFAALAAWKKKPPGGPGRG